MAASQRTMIFTGFGAAHVPAYQRWRAHVDAVERYLLPADPAETAEEWLDGQAMGAMPSSLAVQHLRSGRPLYIWRLVATLRRTLGISSLAFPSLEVAQADAARTIEHALSLAGRRSRHPDGLASWALHCGAEPVAVAARWHDNTSDCGSDLRDALDSLPRAGMTVFLEEHVAVDPVYNPSGRMLVHTR